MKLDGHRMDTYVQRSPIKSDIPDYTDWYWGFVRDYLSGNTLKGMDKRWCYYDDYYLDIAKIENIASINHFIPGNDTFRDQVKGLTPDQVRIYADHIFDHYHENIWAAKMRLFLQNLDRDFETTLSDLNNALAAYMCRPTDDQYEDFYWPKFQIVNAERYAKSIRELNLTDDEGKFVQLSGWLTYVQDPPLERIISAEWMCDKCQAITTLDQQPKFCETCQKQTHFSSTSMETEKFQECILTENFEDSTGFPTSISIILSGENTGNFSPGDRIVLVGLLTSREIKTKTGEILFSHRIDVHQLHKEDDRKISYSEDDLKEIDAFSHKPDVLNRLAEMYAPSIIGHDYAKKAILLQAAGTEDVDVKGSRKRGQIHILLIGDPGLGKSQLLKANHMASPKSIYVSDASAAGLTAAVSEVNGKRVMQAGVLVLADGGVACIDELDKMKREDREGIHTAMEQGVISKSKAGLHAHFKSRTSVIAAANPKYGRFDPNEPIADQVDLETPLLNRFDLIYIFMEQKGTEAYEISRAEMILSGGDMPDAGDFLLKYINRTKSVRPRLTKDVAHLIATYFANIKKSYNESYINPRTLESMNRLCLASARIRMSETTEEIDFQVASELMDMYLKQFNFDLDAISGITNSVREAIRYVKELVGIHKVLSEDDIISDATKRGFDRRKVIRALEEMFRKGEIYDAGNGRYGSVN